MYIWCRLPFIVFLNCLESHFISKCLTFLLSKKVKNLLISYQNSCRSGSVDGLLDSRTRRNDVASLSILFSCVNVCYWLYFLILFVNEGITEKKHSQSMKTFTDTYNISMWSNTDHLVEKAGGGGAVHNLLLSSNPDSRQKTKQNKTQSVSKTSIRSATGVRD